MIHPLKTIGEMVPTAVYTHVASSLAFAAYNNSFNMSESLQGI